jgi:hypothetical protein
MKKLIIAAILASAVAAPAMASDANMIFSVDAQQPLQLEQLSSQEMKTTEGALFNFRPHFDLAHARTVGGNLSLLSGSATLAQAVSATITDVSYDGGLSAVVGIGIPGTFLYSALGASFATAGTISSSWGY